MRILLTRPALDSLPLKAHLEAQGHHVLVAPMLSIVFRPAPVPLQGVQALLFTSANGVRAFAQACDRRDLPAWCVGPATAAAARAAGFVHIEEAGGDAVRLARAVIVGVDPEKGALLHAAGSVAKKELGELLTSAGFDYRRQALYDAEAVEDLPDEVKSRLTAGEIDAVLLFSPRTARLFTECLEQAGLGDRLASTDAYCLSEAVATVLKKKQWRSIYVAEAPDQSSLLSLIERAS